MILFYGAVGFIFATLAPGYLICRTLKLDPRLPPLAGPIALSLIVNNILVEGLTAAGLYLPAFLRPLGCLTVGAALVALWLDERLSIETNLVRLRRFALYQIERFENGQTITVCFELFVIFIAIIASFDLFLDLKRSTHLVFTGYDSVALWNRWAVDWFHNGYPSRIYHYPQLIPAIWSIPYVMMGNNFFELFSAAIKIVFFVGILDTFVFLAARLAMPIYAFAIPLTLICFLDFVKGSVLQEYVDVPVAFFALLGVALLFAARNGKAHGTPPILSLLMAAGAAMTKQVGLYMFASLPALMLVWDLEERGSLRATLRLICPLLWRTILMAALASPVYIYAIVTVLHGTNTSELSYLFEGIYGGQDRLTRTIAAFDRFPQLLQTALWLFLPCLLSLLDKRTRWILLFICVPFTFLWAANFSYDNRNLAMVLPLWSLCAAQGYVHLAAATDRLIVRRFGSFAILAERPAARRLERYGIAAIFSITLAIVIPTQIHRWPEDRLREATFASSVEFAGSNRQIVATMMATVDSVGTPWQILSEWRWACQFKSTLEPERCRLISADDFFAKDEIKTTGDDIINLILIVYARSLTSGRLHELERDGFIERAHVVDGDDVFFFTRKLDHKISNRQPTP